MKRQTIEWCETHRSPQAWPREHCQAWYLPDTNVEQGCRFATHWFPWRLAARSRDMTAQCGCHEDSDRPLFDVLELEKLRANIEDAVGFYDGVEEAMPYAFRYLVAVGRELLEAERHVVELDALGEISVWPALLLEEGQAYLVLPVEPQGAD